MGKDMDYELDYSGKDFYTYSPIGEYGLLKWYYDSFKDRFICYRWVNGNWECDSVWTSDDLKEPWYKGKWCELVIQEDEAKIIKIS
jgi:hypothetical protein